MLARRSPHFTRDPAPLDLRGIRAGTLGSLRCALAEDGDRVLLATDLTLGAWRGHHAASELSAQLGLAAESESRPARAGDIDPSSGPSFADVVGAFIDREGRGDWATLAALDRAARIAGAGPARPRTFLVLVPRFGLSWEREDVLLVRFLTQAIDAERDRLILVASGSDEPRLPADWRVEWSVVRSTESPLDPPALLGLVPGTLDRALHAQIRQVEPDEPWDGLSLVDGSVLIPPEWRRDPGTVSRFLFDRLALATRPDGWVHAYAQVHGNNFYVDPWFLWSQARRELDAGGFSVALRLVERARECARDPLQRAVLQSTAQGVRLAAQRFEEATKAPAPVAAASPELRGFELEARGWALTMIDAAAAADACFREAKALIDSGSGPDRAHLYLLNIWALTRLKLGDLDGALALERQIEDRHADLPSRDWHLEYVNAINIARLHRRRGDFHAAEAYYRRAFATVCGARTEADALYANVCWARLEEARGRPGEAFAAWLRAALHWVSSAAPEALAGRVATAVIGRRINPGTTDPEEVSSALEEHLLRSAAAMGSTDGLGREPPVFVRATDLADATLPEITAYAFLGPSAGVVVAGSPVPAPIVSPRFRRLRALVARLLCHSVLPPQDAQSIMTMVVDDRLGIEVPQTQVELLECCLRLGVHVYLHDGTRRYLDDERRARLESRLLVRLGPAVDRLEGRRARFKRYLPPRALGDEEWQIIQHVSPLLDIETLWRRRAKDMDRKRFLALLRGMERDRLIRLELQAEAAGEALP
jgi:tetratricopeptide (TPR) repeat protein